MLLVKHKLPSSGFLKKEKKNLVNLRYFFAISPKSIRS